MQKLPANLQAAYCCTAVMGVQQPLSIASPTIVAKTLPPDINGNVPDTSSAEAKQAELYGENFHTCSYALGEHFTCNTGEDGEISNGFGPVAVMHAMLLSQMSLVEVEKACLPFAKADSAFLPCQDKSCECNSAPVNVHSVQSKAVKPVVSSKFEKMLLGVSQNIALSSNIGKSNTQNQNTGGSVSISPVGRVNLEHVTPSTKPNQDSTQCTAAVDFKGTCRCTECVATSKFLNICQLVASATNSYQKSDNYVEDQTVCGLSAKSLVPQYTGTEFIAPFMTLAKSVLVKTSADNANVALHVGMCMDDCENQGMKMQCTMKTLPAAASAVTGYCFHKAVADVKSTADLIAQDTEQIRQMHMGDLSTQDQRRILLFCETSKVADFDLTFLVTGSPSQAADTAHPATKSNMNPSTNTNAQTDTHAVSIADGCTPHTSVSDNVIELHQKDGIRFTETNNKKPLHPRNTHFNTDGSHDKTSTDTESEESGGTGGHCTMMISITTKGGLRQSVLAEGTAPILMIHADQKIDVEHRTFLGSTGAHISDELGQYGDDVKDESCVDIKQSCTLASHVIAIAQRFQVPGSMFRPRSVMGYGPRIKKKLNFYRLGVSVGGYQMVQSAGPNEITPGVDVKMFMNQVVSPVISGEDAIKGPEHIRTIMGKANCAWVQMHDPKSTKGQAYSKVSNDFRMAMSPLRFKKKEQEELVLKPLGGIKSLTVEFPDSFELDKKHGNNYITMSFSHVAIDDSTEGRTALRNSVAAICKQFNKDYVNVRFSDPMIMTSGEILTHYRIYNVKADPLVP